MSESATITTKPRRRWLQFNLRTGFIVMTLAGLLLAGGLQWWHWVRREARVADELTAKGALVEMGTRAPEGMFAWLMPKQVPCIKQVGFYGPQFVDNDLTILFTLKHLDRVLLRETSVTYLAAERLAEHCEVYPSDMDLSSSLYLHPDLYDLSGGVELCDLIASFEHALNVRLAVARFRADANAVKQAHEQCIAMQRGYQQRLLSDHGFEDTLNRAWATLLELRLAANDGQTAKLPELTKSCHDVGHQLFPKPGQPCLELAYHPRIDNVILATQIVREMRVAIARLEGNRAAELQASDEAIATLRNTLSMIFGNESESLKLECTFAGALTLALEAEKRERARITQKVPTLDEDVLTLRRLELAHADVTSQMQFSEYEIPELHELALLEIADRLIFETLLRHGEIPLKDPMFPAKYGEFLRYLVGRSRTYSVGQRTYSVAYLMRQQERGGLPVCQVTQHQLHELQHDQRPFVFPQSKQLPDIDDWRQEYADELRDFDKKWEWIEMPRS